MGASMIQVGEEPRVTTIHVRMLERDHWEATIPERKLQMTGATALDAIAEVWDARCVQGQKELFDLIFPPRTKIWRRQCRTNSPRARGMSAADPT